MRVRDARGGGWFYVHNELIRRYGAEVGEGGIAVYCVLAMVAREQQTAMSAAKIASLLGVSRRHVMDMLARLEARNIVSVGRRAGAVSIITLTAPETWTDADVEQSQLQRQLQPELRPELRRQPNPRPEQQPQSQPQSTALAFDTPGALLLQRLLTENARAAGRRGPQRFRTLEAKRRWIEVERHLGSRLEAALRHALAQGIDSIPRLTSYLARVAENGNGRAMSPAGANHVVPATRLFRAGGDGER